MAQSNFPSILRVTEGDTLIPPGELRRLVPNPSACFDNRVQFTHEIEHILQRKDTRKLLIVGPCSIHDPDATIEYARRLKTLSEAVSDKFLIIMRTYFEKPRTIVGWKGWINDVNLDGSRNFNEGYKAARTVLKEICKIGLPTACEIINPISILYLFDLLSWICIGARTVESQVHREFASGVSTPVGFKNATNGDVTVAINAMQAAKEPHSFIGCDDDGKLCHLHSTGNNATHLILRGGSAGTNYQKEAVQMTVDKMQIRGLTPNIMIDCSHGNSQKQPSLVPGVFNDIIDQIADGNEHIIGIMLESFLIEGRQDIPADLSKLTYGQSITDPCISWEMTEKLIMDAYRRL